MLPTPAAYLDEVEAAVREGCAHAWSDETAPPGASYSLMERLGQAHCRTFTVWPAPGAAPLEIVASELGVPAAMSSLTAPELMDCVVVVHLDVLPDQDLAAWTKLADRLRTARRAALGASLLLVGGTAPSAGAITWRERMRRVDAVLWAELHAPPDRPRPVGELASALAAELCVWRLDLAASLAAARWEILCDPIEWLAGRTEAPIGPRCIIALRDAGRIEEIRRRVWKAQLSVLFPWLEEVRQVLIDRHRGLLTVTDWHMERGVSAVDDLELGAIAKQVSAAGRLGRDQEDILKALGRVRNDLAHRAPTRPEDLRMVLRNPASLTSGSVAGEGRRL